ncbi:riboflavin synthase, alpha subunit [Kwoniella newhampshirensis]|uniref:Riboflavin synthase n=1 Tax=Kwoniella newhampshirensis TaxID=1651941 RepID=A0AAW0Z489_9TREE
MFTGLIEHTSRISSISDPSSPANPSTEDEQGGFTLTLDDAAPILGDCSIGDSICINGACLTVTAFGDDWFKVGLAPETLTRTNLGEVKVGDKVNCERAMAGHTRFGGHMVQGHVDSTATIISKKPDGDSIRYRFQLPPSTTLLPYIVEKGYITLDGASLTITEVDDRERSFGIMLIAHSQEKLTLTSKDVGSTINVEVDCVGKYVLGSTERIEAMVDRIVEKKMKEKGLL